MRKINASYLKENIILTFHNDNPKKLYAYKKFFLDKKKSTNQRNLGKPKKKFFVELRPKYLTRTEYTYFLN